MKIKIRYTYKKPMVENGLIFVAHRPLLGTKIWEEMQGLPIYGRHFAQITDDDEFRKAKIKNNIKMDARLIKIITDAEIREWYVDYCNNNYTKGKASVEDVISNNFEWVCDFFFEKNNDAEVDIE